MSEATSWLPLQGMTEADLEANRRGELTEGQVAKLRKELRTRRTVLLVAVGFAAFGTIVGVALRAARARDMLVSIPVIVAIDLLFGLFIDWLVNGRIRRGLRGRVVTPVEGTLDGLVLVPTRAGFLCKVGGAHYQAGQADAIGKALTNGDRVRIYILPRTRQIVAVEKLS